MKEKITVKQIYILVLAIVVGIAFIETSGAIWSMEFWKGFLFNIVVYGLIAEFAVLLLNSFQKNK